MEKLSRNSRKFQTEKQGNCLKLFPRPEQGVKTSLWFVTSYLFTNIFSGLLSHSNGQVYVTFITFDKEKKNGVCSFCPFSPERRRDEGDLIRTEMET